MSLSTHADLICDTALATLNSYQDLINNDYWNEHEFACTAHKLNYEERKELTDDYDRQASESL